MLTSGAFGYLFDYLVGWALVLSLLLHTWCFFRCFPRTKFRKTGLVIGNGLVFACLLGIVALAAESYLRFAYVATDSFGVSLPARRWFALYTKLNSLGCRDREWALEKAPGVRRIAFVGDSFTYGWGIEDPKDRFTDRIQALFDARAPRTVEVMNVSKPGWDTGEELRAVEDALAAHNLDEVVLCYVANDPEDLIPTDDDFNPTRPPEPWFFSIDSSCLLDYLYRLLIVPRVPSVRGYHDWLARAYQDPGIWEAQSKRLQAFVGYCAARNIRLRVTLLPMVGLPSKVFDQEQIFRLLLGFFHSRQVPVCDLWPAIADIPGRDLMVNALDAHPNRRAHQLFAERIWRELYGNGD